MITRNPHRPGRNPGLALAALLILGGCAGREGDFPSFAVPTMSDETERLSVTFPGVRVPEPVTPAEVAPPLPDDLDGRISAIVARAGQASAAFEEKLPRVRSQVLQARGASVTSDRWAEAEISFADLSSIHGTSVLALADLDELAARAMNSLAENRQIGAIDAPRTRIGALIQAQDAALEELGAALDR